MMAAKKTKQKTKAPGGGYVVGPHRWCFHRWPQEFGLNIDKVDAGQKSFCKMHSKKTQPPASISFASNSFFFPFNFLFSTTFFFPSCRPHYQKRNHQSVVSCLFFWLTTAAKALSWGCHSHIRSSPMVFFLVGPLKVQKMPATVTLSWDGISDPRDGISDPRGGISDPGDGSSDLFQYIC